MPSVRLHAWARREETRELLRRDESRLDGVFDSAGEAVEGSDLVILAMPTGSMAEVVASISSSAFGSDTLVTDVGSVKGPVLAEVAPLVEEKGGRFVGSHPMAGSEKTGLEFADHDLFREASVIVTPSKEDPVGDMNLQRFWEALGGEVTVMDAESHDRVVAAISHLPHLVAAALARSVLGSGADAAPFSGGGFRDTTRVAGGPEEMWTGILVDNQEAVSDQLSRLIADLEIWKDALDRLDREQLRGFLSEARKLRESL